MRILVAFVLLACGPPPGDARSASGPERRPDPTPEAYREILDAHNRLRKRHCAPALVWADELARAAQAWADSLASRGCSFGHSGSSYGENLAAGTESALGPAQVVDMWYGEIEKYDFGSGSFSMETGHFTQVVWKDTRRLGCGSASCKGLRIWVCQYDPPGNVDGEYRGNVTPATTSCGRE